MDRSLHKNKLSNIDVLRAGIEQAKQRRLQPYNKERDWERKKLYQDFLGISLRVLVRFGSERILCRDGISGEGEQFSIPLDEEWSLAVSTSPDGVAPSTWLEIVLTDDKESSGLVLAQLDPVRLDIFDEKGERLPTEQATEYVQIIHVMHDVAESFYEV